MLIYSVKKLKMGLHALILNENVLPLLTFSSGLSYSAAYDSSRLCDRSKLFVGLKWPINCLLGACYFYLKYLLRKL